MLVLIPGIIIIIAAIAIAIRDKGKSGLAPAMVFLAVACLFLTTWLSTDYWITLDISRTDDTISINPEVYKRHDNYGLIPIEHWRIMQKSQEIRGMLRWHPGHHGKELCLSSEERECLQAILAEADNLSKPYEAKLREKQTRKAREAMEQLKAKLTTTTGARGD
jgi:hypothetical protein